MKSYFYVFFGQYWRNSSKTDEDFSNWIKMMENVGRVIVCFSILLE
jgi:hypothetical protein